MATQTPATAEIETWLRIRFFTNFWIRVRKKNAEFESGSERKTRKNAEVTPDPVPPLVEMCVKISGAKR